MSETPSKTAPRRRFVPVPIETTFERYRKGAVPPPSPSPSPSPQSTRFPPQSPCYEPQAKAKEKPERLERPEKHDMHYRHDMHGMHDMHERRRFAPQLIESSRRSRRVGDVGPATRPTDKTDITPYHHHIYAPKSRKKHRRVISLARRESCDDETADQIFETLVRENEKQILEDALAAFPNSRARAGGAEHFAIREGSDDDSSASQSHRTTGDPSGPYRSTRRTRRDSLTEDVGWALKEMQEHHSHLARVRSASIQPDEAAVSLPAAGVDLEKRASAKSVQLGPAIVAYTPQIDRISTLDLDRMSIDSPPCDPLWTTTAAKATPSETKSYHISDDGFDLSGSTDGYRGIPAFALKLREAEGETEEDDKDEILRESIASTPKPYNVEDEATRPSPFSAPGAVAVHGSPEEFRGRGPFAGYRNRDLFAERDVNKLRRRAPPMLGKDLVFRQCESPKHTKLEPQYLWNASDFKNDAHRDATGKNGLWQGYCYSENNEALAPFDRPIMLETPFPPSSPHNPFDLAFSASDPGTVYAEPSHMDGSGKSSDESKTPPAGPSSAGIKTAPSLWTGGPREKKHLGAGGHNGLHVLMSLDERLQKEKEAAERDENIAAEFTDTFVTQVYNYLSLGYPAMARAYDEELSKITRVPVPELERLDAGAMDDSGHAIGHISLGDEGDRGATGGKARSTNHDDYPRWHALKLYIYEWARQHPDLNSISPLAWGVRERRGSWGV